MREKSNDGLVVGIELELLLVAVTKVKELCAVAEVCSGEELPEVEIISLLEEQIPRYRLRADTLTQFQGKLCRRCFSCFFSSLK